MQIRVARAQTLPIPSSPRPPTVVVPSFVLLHLLHQLPSAHLPPVPFSYLLFKPRHGSRDSVELTSQESQRWRSPLVRFMAFPTFWWLLVPQPRRRTDVLAVCPVLDRNTCILTSCVYLQPCVWQLPRHDQEVRHQLLPTVLPRLRQGHWVHQGRMTLRTVEGVETYSWNVDDRMHWHGEHRVLLALALTKSEDSEVFGSV